MNIFRKEGHVCYPLQERKKKKHQQKVQGESQEQNAMSKSKIELQQSTAFIYFSLFNTIDA